jgi:hypothetical protein
MNDAHRKFCENPTCYLHVDWIAGHNWAELPDGRIYGRATRDGRHYCDACLKSLNDPVTYPFERK